MTAGSVAAILLAAGRGLRFGGGKLGADLGGRPVAHHAASTLAAVPFALRFAVVSAETPDLTAFGFAPVSLEPEGAPMSRSIALGIAAAGRAGADAALIALADMPLIPRAHFEALIAAFDGDCIGTRGPAIGSPAIFGRRHFAGLIALTGDRGAHALLKNAPVIDLAPELALDIDAPADLAEAAALLTSLR